MGSVGTVSNDETGQLRHDTANAIMSTTVLLTSGLVTVLSMVGTCMKASDA